MKISPRKAANPAAQRRIDLQVDRSKTSPLRVAYPGVGVIHIHLGFAEPQPPHSPQVHSLYPAASAFFRFACPCVDCDGEFDLAATVAELASAGAPAKRAGRSVTGKSHCGGVHWRESNHSEPCRIELNYRVVVSFTP